MIGVSMRACWSRCIQIKSGLIEREVGFVENFQPGDETNRAVDWRVVGAGRLTATPSKRDRS